MIDYPAWGRNADTGRRHASLESFIHQEKGRFGCDLERHLPKDSITSSQEGTEECTKLA